MATDISRPDTYGGEQHDDDDDNNNDAKNSLIM